MTGEPTAWFETLDVEQVHAGFSRVRRERIRTPDGAVVEREVVDHDDAVAIVPITSRDEVVLLRQYRQPFQEYVLEVPAGTLDVPGESPVEAAVRELAEEAQQHAPSLTLLTTFYNSAGWSTERTHVFLAEDVTSVSAPDGFVAEAEEADMEIVLVPFADLVERARGGELVDAKTALGVLLAAAHRAGAAAD
ncbi:MAG: NUDIX hydrolase [Nitriliruptoraceae bacterium]